MVREPRIKFLRDIIEPATSEHPDLILAKKGEYGRIYQEKSDGRYSVYWDNWQNETFLAEIDKDFVVSDYE